LDSFANKLQFVVVSDFTAANAFDDALKGSDYVIHVASPLAKPNEDLLTPAVKGTTSILQSASKTPTVKKVVITASVASLIPLGKSGDGISIKGKMSHLLRGTSFLAYRDAEDIAKEELYFDKSIVPTLEPFGQYQASKLAAHTATLDYVLSQKPQYSVITIHPGFVFGRNILQTSADELAGTNGMLFGSLYAKEPMFAPYRGVHVLDVAEAHIRALDLEDAPVSSFLLSGKDRPWEEVLRHARKEFPDADFQTEPKTGDRWFVDTTRAEAQLSFKTWREMEVQVKDVVSQQLELRSS